MDRHQSDTQIIQSIDVKLENIAHCKKCSLGALCLPLALDNQDIERLDRIINRGRPIAKGEYLFHQGDAFDSIFAVRSGSLKTQLITNTGQEQITGFYTMTAGRTSCSVVVISPLKICRFNCLKPVKNWCHYLNC